MMAVYDQKFYPKGDDPMRILTIKRKKKFVACLGKLKVYIEDPTSNEIKISGTPCRKLGVLKNGEEKSFPIEETAAKIFVIADKLSKNYCNEFYQLPEGQEDIFLSGENKYNPATGNAFRFDNNDTPEATLNRKRNVRKGLVILAIAAVIGFIIGFASVSLFKGNEDDNPSTQAPVTEQTFSIEGMDITLTSEFQEVDLKDDTQNYTVAYGSENVAVFVLREDFKYIPGAETYTLDYYRDLVLEANDLSEDHAVEKDGLTGFVYDRPNEKTNEIYRYFSYVYKGDDAFWMIQFATLKENADQYEAQILEWAKTVDVSEKK